MLTVNEVKVHSRKQLIAWVQSTNVYKFQQLKNGLFFIKILSKLIPQDTLKLKLYEKPTNVYEYTFNMNGVKKILNKHNLFMNLDIQSIVSSKNCFQFANWFKNLYDQNKSQKDDEFTYTQKNYTPSKTNSSFKSHTPGLKNFLRANSSEVVSRSDKSKSRRKNDFMRQFEKDDKSLVLKYKPGKNLSTLNINQNNFKMKTMASNQKQSNFISPPKKISQSQFIEKKQIKGEQVAEFQDSQTALVNLLKTEALKQSIESYEKILLKVQTYINSSQANTLKQVKDNVLDIIYMKK